MQNYKKCNQGDLWVGRNIFEKLNIPSHHRDLLGGANIARCSSKINELRKVDAIPSGWKYFKLWLHLKTFHFLDAKFVAHYSAV